MTTLTFVQTAEALVDAEGDEGALARPLVDFLPVDGGAISCFGAVLASETISASDAVAERLDEAQFDLGEGPCWDAIRTATPVLEPDWRHRRQHSWPAFEEAIGAEPIGALFAFPLRIGPLQIGAIDLYTSEPLDLTEQELVHAEMLSRIVGRMVLRRALRLADDESGSAGESFYSRRAVHNATGIVIAQLRILPDDAALLIQGHAYATGRTVAEVADAIISGELTITAATIGTNNP